MSIWKDVKGYEGLYEVSNAGEVRSKERVNSYGRRCKGIPRAFTLNRNGYLYVNLCKNGQLKNHLVHRLVAEAFVENPQHKETVNHKNEIKTDNRADNLEWLTLAENLRYGTHTERATAHKPDMSGAKHFNFGKRGAESKTHKGRVIGVKVSDPSVVVEFDTAATAAREMGISPGQLCDTLKGRYKSCKGYCWRRLDG